jgi:metal-responsive CopG/Arc/MetJ family transcriptional regulator
MPEIFRHGDILLKRVDKMPQKKGLVKRSEPIVEYGEVTGHSHRLVGEVEVYAEKESGQTANYIVVPETATKPAQLVHEEHDTIELTSGVYEVTRQREYNPYSKEARRVLD